MFKELITSLIYFTDFLCPTLSPAEQTIALQIFSRTIAVGQDACRISHKDIARLTGLSDITVRKAIRSLLNAGILVMVGESRPKSASTYKIKVPLNLPQTFKIQRNPYLLFKEEGEASAEAYKLTPEGKDVLDVIKNSLSSSEMSDIYRAAQEELGKNENLEGKVDAIIIRRYFSEEKKKKYIQSDLLR